MKYVLLLMILGLSAPAWARSSTCEEAGQDLRAIEQHLFLRTMDGSNCGSRTPAQLGLSNLSSEQTTYFENSRCKNLTQVEEELALLESRLLVSDGLSELRNAVVRNQNTLSDVSNPRDLARRATTFARDVALGSLIQDLINPQQSLVNEVRQAQGEDWWAKVRSVCGAVANRGKPFCQNVGNYLESDPNADSIRSEFAAFMNELNQQNTTAEALATYNNLLTVQSNGQPTTFYDLWGRLRNSEFDTFLQQQGTGGRLRPPTRAQLQLVRGLNLSTPAPAENSYVQSLATRLRENSVNLEQNGQLEILLRTMNDNADRHLARAKARWSQVWVAQAPSRPVECNAPNITATDFLSCVDRTVGSLNIPGYAGASSGVTNRCHPRLTCNEGTMLAIVDSIRNGAQMAKDSTDTLLNCLSRQDSTRLVQTLTATTPAAPCNGAGLGDVTHDQVNRTVLQAIRNSIAQQENVWLQYRERAVSELAKCEDSITTPPDYNNPICMGLNTQVSVAPLVQFSFENLMIISTNLRGPAPVISDRTCNSVPVPIRRACLRSLEPERRTVVNDVDRLPATILRNTRVDTRDREMEAVIVSDAIQGAVRNVTGTFFNTRSDTDALRRQLAMYARPQPYQPYSGLPPGACSSLAASVLCYGTLNLGYGTYYNNFNSSPLMFSGNPQGFRNYFGLTGQSFLLGPTPAAPAPTSSFFSGTSLSSAVLGVGQFGQ